MLGTSPAQASGEFASTTFLTLPASKVIIDKIVCCIDFSATTHSEQVAIH